MTYPPQQPGPFGQQGPGGSPPQGPFPPPPPQTPPWLVNGPDGFPSFEPDPRKPRTGRIASVIIVGLLVLGGGGLGLWLLTSRNAQPADGGGTEARTVADRYVRDIERTVNTPIPDIDVAPLEPVTCTEDFERMEREIGDLKQSVPADESVSATPRVEIGMKDFRATADTASFTLTQVDEFDVGRDQKMTMAKERGAWKVCGLFDTSATPSSSPVEPTRPSRADESAGTDEPGSPDETIELTVSQVPGDDGDGGDGSAAPSGPVPNPVPTR